MLRIILVVLMVHLSGCIIVPTFTKEPYQESEITRVQPNRTSRTEIVELFAQPDVTRENDTIWIYGEARRAAFAASIRANFSWINDYQYLVVEFKQDIVNSIELVEAKFGCSSTGVCLHYAFAIGNNADQLPSLRPDLTLVGSKREDDQRAKEFQSVPDKCSLYIYQKYRLGRVAVGSLRNVLIGEDTYLYLPMEPGLYLITALNANDRKGQMVEKSIECKNGDVLFIEIAEEQWSWGNKPDINVVDYEIGRRAIIKRNLILLP